MMAQDSVRDKSPLRVMISAAIPALMLGLVFLGGYHYMTVPQAHKNISGHVVKTALVPATSAVDVWNAESGTWMEMKSAQPAYYKMDVAWKMDGKEYGGMVSVPMQVYRAWQNKHDSGVNVSLYRSRVSSDWFLDKVIVD